jgi:predicted nucleotidyltransferase
MPFEKVANMKPSDALQRNRDAIRLVVESHRARNARVFGSAARGEDEDASDLDILIDPTPETSLLDIGAIRHELNRALGVRVDVLTPKSLPETFREQILREAVPI